MNKIERIKMIKAMNFIENHNTDSNAVELWSEEGISPHELCYSDLSILFDDEYKFSAYITDDKFRNLMRVFLQTFNSNRYCTEIKAQTFGNPASFENIIDRIKLVKCMEFISRQINDEEIFECWLIDGVADGDICYSDLSVLTADSDILDYYISLDNISILTELFSRIMYFSYIDGGLYCDNILS